MSRRPALDFGPESDSQDDLMGGRNVHVKKDRAPAPEDSAASAVGSEMEVI